MVQEMTHSNLADPGIFLILYLTFVVVVVVVDIFTNFPGNSAWILMEKNPGIFKGTGIYECVQFDRA